MFFFLLAFDDGQYPADSRDRECTAETAAVHSMERYGLEAAESSPRCAGVR